VLRLLASGKLDSEDDWDYTVNVQSSRSPSSQGSTDSSKRLAGLGVDHYAGEVACLEVPVMYFTIFLSFSLFSCNAIFFVSRLESLNLVIDVQLFSYVHTKFATNFYGSEQHHKAKRVAHNAVE
jgi:hypothetical protein